MFLETNTLYTIALTILFTSFGIPFLKVLFGPKPMPKINIQTLTRLPTMTRRDLALCITEVLNDPTEHYFLLDYSATPEGEVTFKLGYKEQGKTRVVSLMCKVDDSLKPKYPLSKRK